MMDLPADVPLLWVGLVLVGVSLVGIAGALPTRPAPDAPGLARTVDSVAAGEAPTRATTHLAGDSVRLSPHGVAVRRASNPGGAGTTAHAEFGFGPVTPVPHGSPLRAVLRGEHPQDVFESPVRFQQAVVEARTTEPGWTTGDALTVRGVNWDGYRVTLVGV